MTSANTTSFDIGLALEGGRLSRTQGVVLALIALAIALDGFDNQVLGFAVPLLLREWHISRETLAPVFALGFAGMAIGTIIGGALGDQIGRRPALILSVLVFGLFTGLSAFARNVEELAICRTIAGLGMGGAMPSAATLLAEFAPANRRSMAVTLGIVCIPLGGVIGGVIASQVLPVFGWRILFAIAGVAPWMIALLQIFFLPESPRFLVRDPARHRRLARLMTTLGHDVAPDAGFIDSLDQSQRGSAPIRALFNADYRLDTPALWAAFFACLLTTYLVFSWTPQLLTQHGFSLATSSLGLAIFNLGGVAGAIATAALIPRLGTRAVMLAVSAGGALGATGIALLPGAGTAASTLLVALAIEGALINAAQTSLYALAAQMYPVALRSTGVGASAGIGRTGAIASSFVGAFILAGGWSTYYYGLAVGMAVTFVSIALIRRHLKPLTQRD